MVTMPAYDKPDDKLYYSNMLATFSTELDEQSLIMLLKNAEMELDDTPELRKRGIVMMDLDMLQYGEEKHHTDDWQRTYVKQLMEELG
jgi:2-amino-4-hydroxy-6-hydroxymethyldihydropteridine diphosphokinase